MSVNKHWEIYAKKAGLCADNWLCSCILWHREMLCHWFYKHPPSTLFYLTYDTSIRLNMRLWSVPNLLHTHHMLHLHSGLNIAPTTSYQLYSKSICTQHFCKWWPILYIKFEAWNFFQTRSFDMSLYIWHQMPYVPTHCLSQTPKSVNLNDCRPSTMHWQNAVLALITYFLLAYYPILYSSYTQSYV